MSILTANYWNKRYNDDKTGWDLGTISPPLKAYFDQLEDKSLKILIPGAGNAHEALYLFRNGFKNTYVCDWAEKPIQRIQTLEPLFPTEQLICKDFFDLELQFDLIVEQTFFCAISPAKRSDYANKIAQLLHSKGKLVGLLFNKDFKFTGPPFAGDKAEYIDLFEKKFDIMTLEECNNSIESRAGFELFIKLELKK